MVRVLSDKIVIFGVSAYPKPDDILISLNANGSVFPVDTHRVETADFFEMQGRMLGGCSLVNQNFHQPISGCRWASRSNISRIGDWRGGSQQGTPVCLQILHGLIC